MLRNDEAPTFVVAPSDFRETSGFIFPHRIEYRHARGRPLAVESIHKITIAKADFDIDNEPVTHEANR